MSSDIPYIEVRVGDFSEERRAATLLALQERWAIILLRDNGSVFARMDPIESSEAVPPETTPDT